MIDKIEERNPEISLKRKCVDILDLIRSANEDFWKNWVAEQSHLAHLLPLSVKPNKAPLNISNTDIKNTLLLDIPGKSSGLKLIHTHNRRRSNTDFFSSSIYTNLEVINSNTTDNVETDLSFDKNDRLARRLFFDLRQDGPAGTMSYLATSCIKLIFGVNWEGGV